MVVLKVVLLFVATLVNGQGNEGHQEVKVESGSVEDPSLTFMRFCSNKPIMLARTRDSERPP